MGKVRKPRPSKSKKQVTEAVEDNHSESETSFDSKESAVQTILDQLQAAGVEEKYCGLQTLSHLIECRDNVGLVVKSNVIKAAAPLMLDPANSVRNAAAGAMRNLSANGFEACESMLEQDVMTPLICYFHEFAEKLAPDAKVASKKNEDVDTFIQCINLLLNLCESSELAIKYLDESRVLDILPRYLDISAFGCDVVAAVLQCLFVVIEDNTAATEKVKSLYESGLQTILLLESSEPSVLLIKTLAAGVTITSCEGQLASLPVDIVNKIISILASTLSIDHRLACNQLSSGIPLKDNTGCVNPPQGKDAIILEKQIKSVLDLLDAQQSGVEIVANMISCEDAEESMEADDSSDGDEMCDEVETCNGVLEETMLAEDKLPPELMEALVSMAIFDKIWARTQLPADNVMLILKEYEGSQLISKKLHSLQTRALLCINNMLTSLPLEGLGGVSGVYKIWVDAGKLAFKQNANNLTLLESATAVMRAALDKLKGTENVTSNESLFKDLALSDIEMMLNGIRECEVPEIRSNLIRMIGTLGLLLVSSMNETTSNVICSITEFILEQAHKENEVWVLAEAVDTIVDLYSEDETDVLAARVKLVDKLNAIVPLLRNKARQQKRLPNEYRVLVRTAVDNLPRFIKYKKSRVNKM